MKFTDILELAKQGYTPADIKELINLKVSDELEEQPHEENQTDEHDADEHEHENVDTTHEDNEPTPDYKALYEKAQEDLEKAQKKNIHKDVQKDEPSAEETFADLMRSYM